MPPAPAGFVGLIAEEADAGPLASRACKESEPPVNDRTPVASVQTVIATLARLERFLRTGLRPTKADDRKLSFSQRFRASLVDWLEQVVQNTLLPRQNVDACDHSGKDRESLILLA